MKAGSVRIFAKKKNKVIFLSLLLLFLLLLAFFSLFAGGYNMSFQEVILALFGSDKVSAAKITVIQQLRVPRILAAIIAGAGLSLAGLIMQTSLNNAMASPATLGVTNAAVFGANVALIVFAGGYFNTSSHLDRFFSNSNLYSTALLALLCSLASILLILALSRIRRFSSTSIILAGIAISAIWNALTTLLQYYATDVGLSAAVVWSFGDLSRASYQSDAIMLIVVAASSIFFFIMRYRYNALLSGEASAKALGVNVTLLRVVSLFFASLITAVCVSYLGVIAFVGIICPHAMKRLLGENHSFSIPASLLSGSLLLLLADTFSRLAGGGSAIPVGAITTLLGAPFFLFLIFSKKGERL